MSTKGVTEYVAHPHQELAIVSHRTHDTVISVGGVGSGKSITLAMWILDRSAWDTAQEHALFAYTGVQLQQILKRIDPVLQHCGIRHTFNCRPPKAWIEQWRRKGIPAPPPRDRYTNTLVFDTGLQVQLGTLYQKTYEQFRGAEWGSVAIDEFLAGPDQEAIEWVMDRARCGAGRDFCRENHRHTKFLLSNPPESDGHWGYDWLQRMEEHAARSIGEKPSNNYQYLMRGVGPVILIPSRTQDNAENLSDGYIENQLARLDEETARRRLNGEIRRSASGRVYNGFERTNEQPVQYDPARTLYIALDFNNNPAVGLLAHPLNPGEYPSEHVRDDIAHVGVFGEYFHTGGQDISGLCAALLAGDPGNAGHMPGNWRGLLAHQAPVVFFGDATSTYVRMAGNEWQLVDEIVGKALRGRYAKNVPDKNPLVPIGVRAANAKFCAASGLRSLWIDPRCSELITDLMTVIWDKTGRDVQKYGFRPGSSSKLWQRGHLSDALRYLISRLFPLGNEATPVEPKHVAKSKLQVPRMR